MRYFNVIQGNKTGHQGSRHRVTFFDHQKKRGGGKTVNCPAGLTRIHFADEIDYVIINDI